jgi:riboflavin synthase alpha subunit
MVNMIHNGIVEKLAIVEQVVEEFNDKDLEDKKQPIILVFSGSSVINNGVCIQVGSSAEELEKSLEKVPPEAIAELLKAIAVYITKKDL